MTKKKTGKYGSSSTSLGLEQLIEFLFLECDKTSEAVLRFVVDTYGPCSETHRLPVCSPGPQRFLFKRLLWILNVNGWETRIEGDARGHEWARSERGELVVVEGEAPWQARSTWRGLYIPSDRGTPWELI